MHTHMHTHTHTRLTALCPGLPGWAGTRKVKPMWILLEQETVSGSGIHWAIWPYTVCTTLQADNHTSTPPLNFFTGRMPFLPPNQQRQSTEGLTQSFSSSCCTRKFYVTPSYIAKNYYCRNCFKYYIPQNMRCHLMTNTFGNDSNSNCYWRKGVLC